MKLSEKYTLEIGRIRQDIDLLKNGHVYERTHVRGDISCHRLGERLDECFNELIAKMERNDDGLIEQVGKSLNDAN